MYQWKIDEMKLLKEQKTGKMVFDCEATTPREDKIAFLDSLNDNRMTHLLYLHEKFKADLTAMPKDKFDCPRTVSVKAWLKKNDAEGLFTMSEFSFGKLNKFFKSPLAENPQRYITNLGKQGRYDVYDDLVDEMFHRQLIACRDEERKWFKEHDPYCVTISKLLKDHYGEWFGVHVIVSSGDEVYIADDKDDLKRRPITMEEAQTILNKREELAKVIAEMSASINITY